MDARDVYNLYSAYQAVYADRESLNEDVNYELEEGYKKLPIDRMLYQASRHGENVGRSGGDRTTSLKRAIRVGSMMGAAENHDAEKSKEKATANFRRGASRQQNEELDLYDVVLEHLLDEGYCDDVESAEIIMANMSEEWLDGILDEAVIGAKKGTIRSVIEKGGKSIKYVQSGGDIVAGDRSAQERSATADKERERQARMAAGRLTVATKRGIERATNRSERTNEWVPGSSLKAHERDDLPTDYRARRRRASGR